MQRLKQQPGQTSGRRVSIPFSPHWGQARREEPRARGSLGPQLPAQARGVLFLRRAQESLSLPYASLAKTPLLSTALWDSSPNQPRGCHGAPLTLGSFPRKRINTEGQRPQPSGLKSLYFHKIVCTKCVWILFTPGGGEAADFAFALAKTLSPGPDEPARRQLGMRGDSCWHGPGHSWGSVLSSAWPHPAPAGHLESSGISGSSAWGEPLPRILCRRNPGPEAPLQTTPLSFSPSSQYVRIFPLP